MSGILSVLNFVAGTTAVMTLGTAKILAWMGALLIFTKPSHESLNIYLFHYYKMLAEKSTQEKQTFFADMLAVISKKITSLTITDFLFFKVATATITGNNTPQFFVGFGNGWYTRRTYENN